MGSAAFTLMIITILSKVTGLLREQFTSFYLGTGSLADIYTTSTNIPFTIFGFIVAGIGTSFIPIYNKIRKEEGERSADSYTSNLVNILLMIATIMISLIFIFAPYIVKIFAVGYQGEKLKLTAEFTKIISLATISTLVSSVFIGYLNLKGSFTVPALTGVIMNVFHIITFIVAYKFNNFFLLAFGFLLAEYLKYLFFPRTLKKEGYKYSLAFNPKDKNIMLMVKMSIPIIISIAAVDLSTIVDQSLATTIHDSAHGAVAALKYAVLILQLISGVIIVSISTAIYPKLSNYALDHKMPQLKKILMESIMTSQILVIPAMVGALVLSKPIVSIIYERGVFDNQSTLMTASVLYYYLPSLLGHSIRDLMVKAFYSIRDIKTPVKITLIEQVINIVFSIVLSKFMGVPGLALGTSIASIFGAIAITYVFRKKYGKINLKRFTISTTKVLIASILMGLVTYFVYNSLSKYGMAVSFISSVVLSILSYAIIIVLMRIPEVKKLVNSIYKKVKK